MSSDERKASGGAAPPASSPPQTPNKQDSKHKHAAQQQQQQQALPPTLFGNHAATVAASSSGGINSGGSGGGGGGGGGGGSGGRGGRSKAGGAVAKDSATASAASSSVASDPSASPPAPQPPLRESWEISADEIAIAPDALPIGEGFFGIVYKAVWREITVCVKRLKNVRGGELANFQKELSLCTQLRHPHLVQFLAASTQKGNLCIVTEWMQGGSLYSWIHEGTRVGGVKYSRSDLDNLLRIATEVARACVYLHASRIAHRDLTSSNILLDENLRAKVGDFGLSKPTAGGAQDSAMSHNGGGGNLLYLAPESFLLQQFTEASDVFAFAVVLNEMMTGARPYKDISPALAASECANRGARPNLSSATPVGIVRLICACWSHDPASRPSFRQCLQTLEELRSELAAEGSSTNDSAASASAPAASSGGSSANDSGNGSSSGSTKQRKSKKSAAPPPPPPINAALEYYAAGISAPAASASASTSPSKSKRSGKHASMPSVSPPATAVDPMYNRPHTPDGNTEEGEGGSTGSATAASTADSLTPLISASPSVSAKDVRLFLLCLKKHLPPHDAFILHKPQVSAIDVLCDPTNKNKKGSGGGGGGNAAGSTSAGTAGTGSGNGSGGSRNGSGHPDSGSSLRSRSEGDSTTDSTESHPRTHSCSPAFISSMYPDRCPNVGELVVCRAKRADDLGAVYDLVEYSAGSRQIQGLAPMQELTRRKMRSISKLVTLGQLDVLRVLHVDAERGCVDLSKKDVSDLLRSEVLTYYKLAEAAHHCVLRTAALLKICSYCLYCSLVWPLAARFEGSVFKLLRLSLTSPTLTLGEYRECACLTKWHATNAAALAGTGAGSGAVAAGGGSAAAPASASSLLTTPRVLPEIARRCEYNRVHLNLSRLTLDCLPRQLVGSEPEEPNSAEGEGAEGTDTATTPKDKERRPRNNRSSSSATSSRRSSNAPQQQQQQSEKPSSGGGGGGGSGGTAASGGSNVRPLTQTLRSLNIEENPLRVLSSRIGLFRRLQEINVNCCGLTEDLPAALADCAGLQRLYAHGNAFERIPSVLRKLLDLTQLNLSANRITRVEIGELSGLTQLLELSLARNALETLLPSSLPVSLQTLDVSANKFARFPESLFGLPNLVSLEIKQNGITVVPAPPPSAMHYPSAANTASTAAAAISGSVPSVWPFLEFCDLSANPIIAVHDALFVGCCYLQWLNLSHTRIDKIPASLFALIKTQQPQQQLTPSHTGDIIEEEKKSETDDAAAALIALAPARASSSVTGLTYLNVTHTALKPSSTSATDWGRLTSGIHHFLFEASAVPKTSSSAATAALNGSAAEFAPAATAVNPMSPPPPASPMPGLSIAAPSAATAASSAPLIAHWTVAQVVSWLLANSLGEFAPAFLDNLVNGDTLLELDKSDLRDLGVTKLGQQKQMLKLIAAQKEAMSAAQQAARSQAATPSLSVSASPALPSHSALPHTNSGGELNLSALSLGARAVDSQQQPSSAQGAPPSVAVRRTNSTISPSGSLLSFAQSSNSLTVGSTATAGAAASSSASDCDPRNCELVKSVLLNVCISHTELCRPVLLRCVVVLLLGSVFSVDEARETLAKTVQAGRDGAAAAGGAICSPFSGLYGGCQRGALSISPLLEPLYALSAPCLLPADGTALIEAATTAMTQALSAAGKGGRVKVCVRPYIVDLLPTDQAAGATLTPAVVAPVSASTAATGAAAAAGSASPATTALTTAPLSSVPSLLLHRAGSAGKHAALAAASAASGNSGGAAAGAGLFGECGEMLAAWTAYRAAKADEAREREAKRNEQEAARKKKAAAKAQAAAAEGQPASAAASGEKKKSKRKEGEKRATKEKNSEANLSAGAFD